MPANAVQKTSVSLLSQSYLFSPSPFVRHLIVSRLYHMEESDTVSADRCFYRVLFYIGTPASRRKPNPKPTKQSLEPKPTKSAVASIPEICQDPAIDAITRTKDGSTYVFKGT